MINDISDIEVKKWFEAICQAINVSHVLKNSARIFYSKNRKI